LVWEPPIAYTGAITGYLVESALYCNYKPLLDARNSEKITPSEARKLTRKMLKTLNNVKKTGRSFVKAVLVGELEGYPVIVSPDAIYFVDGIPKAVIRSKIRKTQRYYRSDWASLILASHILSERYNIDTLTMALVLAVDKTRLMQALSSIKSEGAKPSLGNGWKVVTRIYDGIQELGELKEAISVIVGRENPRPPHPNKCQKCVYNKTCPWISQYPLS